MNKINHPVVQYICIQIKSYYARFDIKEFWHYAFGLAPRLGQFWTAHVAETHLMLPTTLHCSLFFVFRKQRAYGGFDSSTLEVVFMVSCKDFFVISFCFFVFWENLCLRVIGHGSYGVVVTTIEISLTSMKPGCKLTKQWSHAVEALASPLHSNIRVLVHHTSNFSSLDCQRC